MFGDPVEESPATPARSGGGGSPDVGPGIPGLAEAAASMRDATARLHRTRTWMCLAVGANLGALAVTLATVVAR
jgi:hypothetical protein